MEFQFGDVVLAHHSQKVSKNREILMPTRAKQVRPALTMVRIYRDLQRPAIALPDAAPKVIAWHSPLSDHR
jgi:hypothetical protein